jgi:hypothetical protein
VALPRKHRFTTVLLVLALFQFIGEDAGAQLVGRCVFTPTGPICTAGEKGEGEAGKKLPDPVCVVIYANVPAPTEVREDGLVYTLRTWRCSDTAAWSEAWLCQNCPPVPVRPAPPSPDEVWGLMVAFAKTPVGRFAPPVERPGVRMVYGKKFYFRADPVSFATQSDSMTFDGGWTASVVLIPKKVTLKVDGNGSKTCTGIGFDGRTAGGRAAADAANCYVLISNGPKSGTLSSALSISWNMTVSSNIPGVDLAPEVITTTQEFPMGVREVQAVLVG